MRETLGMLAGSTKEAGKRLNDCTLFASPRACTTHDVASVRAGTRTLRSMDVEFGSVTDIAQVELYL